MSRFIKAEERKGYNEIFGDDYEYLKNLAFGKLNLAESEIYETKTKSYEHALVILSGVVTVISEDYKWLKLGGRKNVFDGKATAVYVPCQSQYKIIANTDTQIAICKSKAEEKYEPFVVTPEDVVVHNRGEEQWNRTVYDIIADNASGRVHRIILGETINKPGQWSGYPPHKHDGEHSPEEPNLEEIYHFQVNPIQGFGVQHHYTKDGSIDDAYTIRHGDSFAIDKGYHPVGAAGGYEIYYLWFMAGETGRKLNPYNDPDHRWLT